MHWKTTKNAQFLCVQHAGSLQESVDFFSEQTKDGSAGPAPVRTPVV